jgi:hypothetical protein
MRTGERDTARRFSHHMLLLVSAAFQTHCPLMHD